MYVPALYAQNSQDDYIHLPLVRSDWLLGLRAYHRMADQPQSGTIVGFVPSTGFEVHLPHLENQAEAKVIYFDAQGQPSQTGVAGGGFIAFNVLEGSHTVLVIPNDASAAVSKVVPIDSGNLHILKFDF